MTTQSVVNDSFVISINHNDHIQYEANDDNNNNLATTTLDDNIAYGKEQTRVIHHHHHHHHHYYNAQPHACNKEEPTTPAVAVARFLTPPQVIEKLKTDGVKKSELTIDQTIILSLFAGVFKGIAGSISMLIGGNNPDMQLKNPGSQQLMFGM